MEKESKIFVKKSGPEFPPLLINKNTPNQHNGKCSLGTSERSPDDKSHCPSFPHSQSGLLSPERGSTGESCHSRSGSSSQPEDDDVIDQPLDSPDGEVKHSSSGSDPPPPRPDEDLKPPAAAETAGQTGLSSALLQTFTTGSSDTKENSDSDVCSSPSLKTPADSRENTTSSNMEEPTTFTGFTPVFDGDDDETYRFHCPGPGLYQCHETGLVFDMKAEGDVSYRTVSWNRRLLSPHQKKPAGPLFDVRCPQRSVRRLHLPHCEVPSAGAHLLSAAHVTDEGVEFFSPLMTETHVIVDISGLSAFGIVRDGSSPPELVQASVLLFYKPPVESDVRSLLNILLLPSNTVIRDVKQKRQGLNGHDERYIEVPSRCKLRPQQVYTLSISPGDHPVLVQPTEAAFNEETDDNYLVTFQVVFKSFIREFKVSLTEKSSSCCVWENEVGLCLPGARKMSSPPNEQLLEIRSQFIKNISGPTLQSLLDQLLEKRVINDPESEEVLLAKGKREKQARLVIDTVRKKGESASSEMIKSLSELDPFFCEHLRLM